MDSKKQREGGQHPRNWGVYSFDIGEQIAAYLSHYFEKLPHVYRMFSFPKDMQYRIILKKIPHLDTAFEY